MIAQMSQREKMLTIAIGAAVVLVLNVVLIKFFIGKLAESREARAVAEAKLAKFRLLEIERTKWAQRDTWLTGQLVPMGDKDVVNKNQKEYLQGLAQKDGVLLVTFTPGMPAPVFGSQAPPYSALPVTVEVKGKWDQVSRFLNDLQSPEKMTALEGLNIQVDPNDKTQLKAGMKVTKWFSPKG